MERRRPLKRDGEGARRFAAKRSPLPRSTLPPSGHGTAARRAHPTATDPVTPAVRRVVRLRSGGACEARCVRSCSGVAVHVHHRKLRRHGDHRPVALLAVCNACHQAIHGELMSTRRPGASEPIAYEDHLILHSWDDPEEKSVRGVA